MKYLLEKPDAEFDVSEFFPKLLLQVRYDQYNTNILCLLVDKKRINNAHLGNGRRNLLIKTSIMSGLGVVKCLLKKPGLNINVKDESGNTALLHACFEVYTGIVYSLLNTEEIDVNLSNTKIILPC